MTAPRRVPSLAAVAARHPDLRVVAAATTKTAALHALYRALAAPAYAAANYDALADVVGDLSWLPAGAVRLGWTPSPTLPADVRDEIVAILTEATPAAHRLVFYLGDRA